MRKFLVFILANILLIFVNLSGISAAELPEIRSEAALLVENNSGIVLYEKNIREKKFPASTTKIMTAILALEKGNIDDVIEASRNAVNSIEPGSTHIGIKPGEQLTLNQLLCALLIESANEAANIIAEYISGNIDDFVALMNRRAVELGAKDTNYVNPHGLHNDNHYTTAYDLYLMTKHALTFPLFRELIDTPYMELPPTNITDTKRYLSNTNHLVNSLKAGRRNYFTSEAFGVKTGYTSKAMHCLVGGALKDDMELITVTMRGDVDGYNISSYEDTTALFNYGFDNFSLQTVVKPYQIVKEVQVTGAKRNGVVLLETATELKSILPQDIKPKLITNEVTIYSGEVKAPVLKGDLLGTAEFSYDGQKVGQVDLIADRDVEQSIFSMIKETFLEMSKHSLYRILGLVLLILFLLIVLLIRKGRKRQRYF